MRTYSPKPGDVTRQWHVIDAQDIVLGRLATTAANLLRGKHKPTYAPHMDMGDFVIIINADKVHLSGNKKTQKLAYRHPATRVVCAPSATTSCWRRTPRRPSRRPSRA